MIVTRCAIFVILIVSLNVSTRAHKSPDPFLIVSDGVIVYTNPSFTGHSHVVKLQVIANNIIRVLAAPGKEIPSKNSLVTVFENDPKPFFNVVTTREKLTVKTSLLTATVDVNTGSVSFYNAAGSKILNEKKNQGRELKPAVFEGESSFHIIQSFETSSEDAYYGLGQHQDDIYNYRGQQINLFQNNTEVAIPFLISNKNYGILWDNYSLTRVGDIRSYRPLSSLKLYSADNQAGWLTANYYNNKSKTDEISVQRAESSLDMEFLGESKLKLPTAFNPANGLAVWQGSLSTDFTGVHKFRVIYGGYLKIWLDGKLVLDRWRKAWNPAPAVLDLNMQKDVKVPVRIEWIPEGTESYLSLKWLEPPATEDENIFSFSSEAGQQLDYYFIHGKNMDEIIDGYRKLTGKAPIVPVWALGFWQSRGGITL